MMGLEPLSKASLAVTSDTKGRKHKRGEVSLSCHFKAPGLKSQVVVLSLLCVSVSFTSPMVPLVCLPQSCGFKVILPRASEIIISAQDNSTRVVLLQSPAETHNHCCQYLKALCSGVESTGTEWRDTEVGTSVNRELTSGLCHTVCEH